MYFSFEAVEERSLRGREAPYDSRARLMALMLWCRVRVERCCCVFSVASTHARHAIAGLLSAAAARLDALASVTIQGRKVGSV